MYAGRHVKRIDAKGRVSLPAPFRAALTRDGDPAEVFFMKALHHPAIEAGGARLVADIDAAVNALDPFSPEFTEIATRLSGEGEYVALDPEGRFSLTKNMRDVFGGAEEIVFVGLVRKFQIWTPDTFATFQAKANATAVAHLGGRGGAA
jgi:MraZ protein